MITGLIYVRDLFQHLDYKKKKPQEIVDDLQYLLVHCDISKCLLF